MRRTTYGYRFALAVAATLLFSPSISAQQHKDLSNIGSFATNSGIRQVADASTLHITDVQPGNGAEWWDSSVRSSMRSKHENLELSVEDLLIRSLQYSSQVKVFSELPLIREMSIVEADSAFDWNAFLDTRWDDLSDPVGNTLTVGGGGTRFRDHNISGSAGARRRTRTGGQFEMAQRLGYQDNNSTFFLPTQQGTSRIVMSYTQPLMRQRGKVYNESLIVLARIDSSIASDEFQRQLQSHLLEVVRAYWGLYRERGVFIQKGRAYDRAKHVFARLERRAEIDAFTSQLISAKAEVTSRRSDLQRAAMAVKNAEDRVRSLVNDPALDRQNLELIPVDAPTSVAWPVSMDEALTTAIQCRPEINQALKQIQAACIRVNMSKNELMPVLDLITEAYVAGLRGGGEIGGAWGDQFREGEPGYSIGLQYEVPLGNRSARARHIRRQHELRQLRNQYETTVQTLKLETRVAVRELETSHSELDTKLTALKALRSKSDSILRRWELAPQDGQSGSLVLENLLTAQKQLTQAENEYLASVVTYNLSLMNIKRATGTLLQREQVTIGRTQIDGLPTQVLDKPNLNDVHQPDAGTAPETLPAPPVKSGFLENVRGIPELERIPSELRTTFRSTGFGR